MSRGGGSGGFSGGGFSGGGHSGGGFGGGHNSGGFSGGGRGSSGGFSGGNHGGNHSGGNHYGGGHGSAPIFIGGGYGRNMGCNTTAIIIIIIVALVLIFSEIFYSPFDSDTVQKNTTQRTALVGQVNKTDWYDDEIGWISSPNVLIKGLEDFYNKTGVQPYVLFVDYDPEFWSSSGSLNPTTATAYLEEVYAERFTDEAHFIFAYFECENDSKNAMDGEFRYLSGYKSDTIMDSEAIDILWGYFKINYDDLYLTVEEMIAHTFSQTADNIMSRPTNAFDVFKVIIIIAGVVAVAVVIYLIIKNVNKRKKEKAEETEKILNTPLDTFGDDTSDLEDKYKD